MSESDLEIRGASRPVATVLCAIAVTMLFSAISFAVPGDGAIVWRMWALAFGCLSVVGLLRHPWGFYLLLNDDGVTTRDGETLPYDELLGVVAPPRAERSNRRRFPINLIFDGRIIRIPSRLNVGSDEVLAELRERQPQGAVSSVPDLLADFYRRQVESFGIERVWNCRGREQLGWNLRADGWKTFGLGLILAGFAWVVIGATADLTTWVPGGVLFFFLGLLFTAIGMSGGAHQRKWGPLAFQNGIVIAPIGLAVSQGDLVGQLAWGEIVGVNYPRRSGGGLKLYGDGTPVGAAIEIRVAGALIHLFDVFDRPLDEVHEQIQRNWRPSTQP